MSQLLNINLVTGGTMLAATVLALSSCQIAAAQSLDALVSKGGDVQLHSAYSLDHSLMVPSNTHIKCDSSASIQDAPNTKMNYVLQVAGQSISIEGCKISANGTHMVINVGAHTSGVSFINNQISSTDHANGILLDAPGIHDIKVSNNTFTDLGYGILQNVHSGDLTNLSIDGNTFTGIWADGVEINDPVTSKCCGLQLGDVRASSISVTHNHIKVPKHAGSNSGSGFCIGVAGAYTVEISDNDCVSWSQGIHVEDRAHDIKILRNTVSTNDDPSNTGQSAIWINDGQHLTIAQNKITNTGANGIFLTYDASHQVNDVDITGNEITGCGRSGIFVGGGTVGPMNTRIQQNKISGCNPAVLLSGKLKSVSLHSNQIETKNGCGVTMDKSTNVGDIDIKNNQDVKSGATGDATCGSGS